MVEDNQENRDKCICRSCPSKNECMDGDEGLLYCAKGETSCQVKKNGCICGACVITARYKLTKHYYCLNEKE